MVLAVYYWMTAAAAPAGSGTVRALLVGLVALWGVRLSGYLTWRNGGHGEDSRYRAMDGALPAGHDRAATMSRGPVRSSRCRPDDDGGVAKPHLVARQVPWIAASRSRVRLASWVNPGRTTTRA